MGSEITESASLTAEHDVGPGLPCGTSRQNKVTARQFGLKTKLNHFLYSSIDFKKIIDTFFC